MLKAGRSGGISVEGTPFGRYRLVDLLGRGGMGEVWRAHDTATDRVVAVKVLPEHLAKDESFQQRFRREAHAAARLSDPHVVPIHNYGEIDGRLYVDMRLIEGQDLQSLIEDGPLNPARAVMITEQIARALNAAHKVGLVHRDVKPSNILISDYDFAYLIDFGIARGAGDAGLTGTGNMIGTWHYMAPERLSSGQVDARSDIYALACVLHECLTGSRPFPGDSLERQVAAHLTTPPPRPSVTRRGVSAAFDPVIAKGMAKDPAQRYTTTVELATAARSAVTTPIPRMPPPPPKEAPPRPAAAGGAPPVKNTGPAPPKRPASTPPVAQRSPATGISGYRTKPAGRTGIRVAAAVGVVALIAAAVVVFLSTRDPGSGRSAPQTRIPATNASSIKTGECVSSRDYYVAAEVDCDSSDAEYRVTGREDNYQNCGEFYLKPESRSDDYYLCVEKI